MGNLRGIALMIAAMGGFALEDMLIKQVSATLPASQILILISAGGAAIFAVWAVLSGERLFAPVMFTRAMILRNAGEVFGTFCFVTALTLAPISTVSAILQATPLAVTLGAAVFLGAPVGWRRWTAILVGLAGVLMIVRPGMEGFVPASLLAVGAVAGLSVRDLCTRVAPVTVSTVVLSAWGFGMVALVALVLAPFSADAVMPDTATLLKLACALGFGVTAYYALTSAMRTGDVAVVTPFRYTRLLFALAIGVTVFGERPGLLTLGGAAIVIASGLYTLWRETRRPALTQRLDTGDRGGSAAPVTPPLF